MPKMSAAVKEKLEAAKKRKKSKVSPAKKAELLKRLGSHVAKKGEKPPTKRKNTKKSTRKPRWDKKSHSWKDGRKRYVMTQAHKDAISRGLKAHHAGKKASERYLKKKRSKPKNVGTPVSKGKLYRRKGYA